MSDFEEELATISSLKYEGNYDLARRGLVMGRNANVVERCKWAWFLLELDNQVALMMFRKMLTAFDK